MNERIKYIRKTLGKTQSEFGDVIGVKQTTITSYETGLREPSDAVILSICREFNVNEAWLRTGEGEPFRSLSRDEQIAGFVGEVLADEPDNFKRQLLHVLSELSGDQWELLADIAQKLLDEQQINSAS